MADRNVNIRLSVSDSETVRRALVGLGKDGERALDRLEAAARPASRSLQVVDRSAMAARSTIAAYTRTIAALYAAQRGIRGVLQLAEAAGDAEELRSKFNAVFRELATETRSWAANTAAAVARSKLDLESYLATLQDTFVPLGFGRQQAADLSKTLAQLAIDVASFNNSADDETLDAFTSAIVGNHEAVRRFGIVITEARLKQELMTMGLKDGGKNATEQAKALARLNIIQKSTADAQGDAQRTAGSYTNRVKELAGAWKDFRAELGRFITENSGPVLNTMQIMLQGAQRLIDGLAPIGERSADALQRQIADINQTIDDASSSTDARIRARGEQMMERLIARREELERALVQARKGDRLPTAQGSANEIKLTNDDDKDQQKRAEKIKDVIDALRFQEAQLRRTSTEQAVYNELQRAGVSIDSQAGREIATRVRRIENAKEAEEQRNDELERQQRLLEQVVGPTARYQEHIADLNTLLKEGRLSQQQYNDAIAGMRLTALEQGATSATDGIELALRRMTTEAPSQAKTIADSFTNAFDTMEDHFSEFLATGKFSFRGFVNDIIREQARITSRQLFGALSGKVLGALFPSAAGNIFQGGRVTAFANGGILDRPTFFPLRNGVGLAGEAGPEAIIPLKRGKDGRLGVSGPAGAIMFSPNTTLVYQGGNAGADGPALQRILDENNRRMRKELLPMLTEAQSKSQR